MTDGPTLGVRDLSVHYGRVQAVRRATLEVRPGEIVALLGANGAGKSTLLRAVAGLQAPTEGEVRWGEERLDGLPAHAVARRGLALVPEGRQMLASMTVRDNLLLGAYMAHSGSLGALLGPVGRVRRGDLMRERLEGVYRTFPRLAERERQAAGSLSGGEQQMLAIGRALMSAPRLLLLDEPSIGLAPNLVREILALLAGLRDEGLTILLVEQDARAALRIADRGYVMETGRIVADGAARELLASDRLRRAYLGMV
ncbi:MAG: ABC transporter ATP-binding protein [Chloroflexi bacterium]|nr:ABC transporter ATP-binding protein [Chloroflexota bacterium]